MKIIDIDFSIEVHPAILLIVFFLSFAFSIWWIIRRRKIRRNNNLKTQQTEPYSTIQLSGIVGIIFFLTPIFYIAFSNLVKGILILILFLFRLLHLPELTISILIVSILAFLYFFMFIGVYMVDEYVWPKKTKIEA